MSKPNRTCYCCGRKYYYCPSCPDESKDPKIYTMWDSELCRDIFNVLVDESTKKINTLECKNKLIELCVDKNTVLKESVRKHVDRVMAYEEVKNDVIIESVEEKTEEIVVLENKTYDYIQDTSEEFKIEVDELNIQLEEKNDLNIVEEIKIEDVKKVNKKTRKGSLKNKENSEVD